MCVRVDAYSRTTGNEAADERYQQQQALENQCGDFAKTTAFESEKLALSRTTLRDGHPGGPSEYAVQCLARCSYDN